VEISVKEDRRLVRSGLATAVRKASHPQFLPYAVSASGLAVVLALGVHRVNCSPYFQGWLSPRLAFAGVRPLLLVTGWAAVKVVSFWGLCTVFLSWLLLSWFPELGLCDAILAGATGCWISAYVLGNVFGPIGLFRTPLILAAVGACGFSLLRRAPAVALRRPTEGQALALVALLIAAVITLPVQLGSPIVPFNDCLSWTASAQRVLTFHVYAPFDNDPYGLWGAFTQAPALELFYALLALGTHTRLAGLAETAAMLPMTGLLIFAAYRLGRALFDDISGGMAALMLFATSLIHRTQGMRPTAVVFILVALGLAFFLDSRQSRARTAIGALLLGTAIATQGIEGMLGLAAAGCASALRIAAGNRVGKAYTLSLSGAVLFGAPAIPIAFGRPVPVAILTLMQIGGITLILASGSPPINDEWSWRSRPTWFTPVAVLLLFVAILFDSNYILARSSTPLLFWLGLCGLALVLVASLAASRSMPLASLVPLALLASPVAWVLYVALTHATATAMSHLMIDLFYAHTVEWTEFFLIFPAGFVLALAYRRLSKPVALCGALALLVYPWEITNPYDTLGRWRYQTHSIVEQLAFNMRTAAIGFWNGRDYTQHHWSLGSSGFRLLRVFDSEIAAGRISLDTHILHVTANSGWADFTQYAAFTGINDDPVEYSFDPNNWFHVGSRVGSFSKLRSIVSTPPYILVDLPLGVNPPGYDKIFDQAGLRLYRRHGLSSPATRG